MLLLAFQSLPLWLGAVLAFSLFWALLRTVLRTAWFKGQKGERRVQHCLRRGPDKSVYVALHNVALPMQGVSTQIDHVVVSRFGIFAIETKNLAGRIEGSEHATQWTQHLHECSFAFQNPLRQNYRHTQALVALLQVPPEAVHSVVAFVGHSELDEHLPANVVQGAKCVQFIRSFTEPLWSSAEVQQLVEQLQAQRLAPTRATDRAHVRQLKTRHRAISKANANAITGPSCALCGSPMVLRTARTGAWAGEQFWGCSSYPQCRGVEAA